MSADELVEQAIAAVRRGAFDAAQDALEQVLAEEPRHVQAALRLLDVILRREGAPAAHRTYLARFAPLGLAEVDTRWLRAAFRQGALSHAPPGLQIVGQDIALRWAERAGVPIVRLGQPEAIPVQTIGAQTPTAQVMGNPPYVVDLPDVQVFAYSHMVLTSDGLTLNEAGGHPEFGRFVDHRSDAAVLAQRGEQLLLRPGAFHMAELEEAIWLAGPASDAFGHWLGEFAPRLQFLERHPAFAGRPILVDEGMPATHLELLRLICANRVVVLPRGTGLKVRRLLYAPTPTFFPIHLLPGAELPPFTACCASVRTYEFLRERVTAAIGAAAPSGRKFYLSRAGRSWRRIRNEDEVRTFLEAHGYETVMTEELSFAEQARLFQQAAAIIAPNGSAMQNFIFAPKDVRLFVLTQSNVHNLAAFNGQARALGYSPVFLHGPPVGGEAEKHTDYVVPVAALAPAVA